MSKTAIEESINLRNYYGKPLVIVRDENNELQWESTANALNVIKKDASQWTAEDKQTVADAYREAWESKDCQSLDKMTSAMCDTSYGEMTSSIALLGRKYERSCEIAPNADKYRNVLDALDSRKDAELYYTVNRIGSMPAQNISAEEDNPYNLRAYVDYQFRATEEGMKVSMTTGMHGTEKTKNYEITSMNINKQISRAGIDRLKDIGYEDSEIEAFKRCALTDADATFLNRLAEGDYESAYRVDPSQLSDMAKYQLGNYQMIIATRKDEEKNYAEIQKQINTLFDQKAAEGPHEVVNNPYNEYISEICVSLKANNQSYSEAMESAVQNDIPINQEFLDYGNMLNRTEALWDSFYILDKKSDAQHFYDAFGSVLSDKQVKLEISELNIGGSNQYGYQVNLKDIKSGEIVNYNGSANVEIGEVNSINYANQTWMEENKQLRKKKEDILKNTVSDVTLGTLSKVLKAPIQDVCGTMMDAIKGDGIKATVNTAEKLVASGELGEPTGIWKIAGKVKDVAGEAIEKVVSGIQEYREADKKIQENTKKIENALKGGIYAVSIQVKDEEIYAKPDVNGEMKEIEKEDRTDANVLEVGIGNASAEYRHNMAVWQKEGLSPYLNAIGVGVIGSDEVSNKLKQLSEVINPDSVIDSWEENNSEEVSVEKIINVKQITEEEIQYAIDTMLYGGDFSKIEPEVFNQVEIAINWNLERTIDDLNSNMEFGINGWVLQNHAENIGEQANSESQNTRKNAEENWLFEETNQKWQEFSDKQRSKKNVTVEYER